MNESKMFLDVNEKPTIGKWIILAIQHVFAMFGATILVPILVNSAAGETVLTIPVALVTSGIGTLIYILCTKGKSPVYLGSSFAFITPIAASFWKLYNFFQTRVSLKPVKSLGSTSSFRSSKNSLKILYKIKK